MRRKNIRTFITSCSQKVRLGLRAWADRHQGNLHSLTLARIPQTSLCGLSPLEKMGLNVCSGLLSEGGDLPPLLPQHRGEGPRGKTSTLRSGEKDLLIWGHCCTGESPRVLVLCLAPLYTIRDCLVKVWRRERIEKKDS